MADKIITLDKLKIGQKGTVKALNNDVSLKGRLMDIGLILGASVECVLVSPLFDPKAYLICGAVIAIRNEDAANIEVILR